MVYQVGDTVNERGIWTAHKGKNKPMSLSTNKFKGELFKIKYCDTNIVKPVVNTMTSAWYKLKNDTSTHDTIYIGADDSLTFKGKIAECLVYNEFLLAKDLQRVQSYLCLKYGVTLEDLDYLDSRKNIIWDHTINANYSNGIAGIGRDTIFGLNQKQSSSTTMKDIVTISANAIAPTNLLNNTTITQGDYIIWGTNGQGLLSNPIDSSLLIKTLDRTWMVQVSGTTAYSIPTSLEFDVSGITYDSARIWLVVDREGSGSLNLMNIEYIQPDSITLGIAYFSNIMWDTDHNSRDLFTLMFDKTPLSNSYHPPSSASTSAPQGDPPNDPTYPNYPNIPQPFYPLINSHDMTHTDIPTDPTVPQYNFNNNIQQGDIIYELYPNPTTGSFTLNISLTKTSNVLIKIHDLQGQIIQQLVGDGQSKYYFTGFVPISGSYFIDILSDQQHKYLKLIVR